MVKLDAFVFGYRYVTVRKEDSPRLATVLLKKQINSEVTQDGKVVLRERDYKRLLPFLNKFTYTASEVYGILGLFLKWKKRYGVILGIVFAIALNTFLPMLVWDVRVSGASSVSEYSIVECLKEQGFGVGSLWHSFDKNKVENSVLDEFKELSWITVNRRGSVAYVEVMEKKSGKENSEEKALCTNIVADRDAVIDEITVVKGVAAVKVGDVVKKGDILISGIIHTPEGYAITRAEGVVKGQTTGKLTETVCYSESYDDVSSDELYEFSVEILGLHINIFKKYGNLDTSYDIIENKEDCMLFDRVRLPIRIFTKRILKSETKTVEYSRDMLPSVAGERLRESLNNELGEYDLIKLHTYGDYINDGYSMTAEYVYSSEIGETVEVGIDKE